jgi:hypothetical protein
MVFEILRQIPSLVIEQQSEECSHEQLGHIDL